MKRILVLLTAVACLASCANGASDALETANYIDTTNFLTLQIEAQLPTASDDVTASVREQLLDVLYRQIDVIDNFGEEQLLKRFEGDASKLATVVDYYGESLKEKLVPMIQTDATDRLQFTDDGFVPKWECAFSLKRVASTPAYWVFDSTNYLYLGGAHGGVSGVGFLTFNKKDGSLVEKFVDDSCTEALQPVIREGLCAYLSNDGQTVSDAMLNNYLFLDGDIIPLPSQAPYPTKEGLVFTYQQYEIAPYALGMPSFTVPYDKVKEFLTPEASAILAQ